MPHSPPHSVTSFISVPRAPIHSLGQNQYRRFSLIQIQVHMYVLLFGEKKNPTIFEFSTGILDVWRLQVCWFPFLR